MTTSRPPAKPADTATPGDTAPSDIASDIAEKPEGERIAKVLARAGVCSRRDGEKMIAERRVSVDGHILDSPAVRVLSTNVILVDGKPLPEADATRLWLYHKPTGLVTTHKDEQDRPTVFDKLKKRLPRVISVGRLDLNSEGLLLLTNDGALARSLELPSRGWVRRYRVRVLGTPNPEKIAALANGITVEGVTYGPIHVTIDTQTGRNAWLTVSLSEGKNREIRKVMEHIGLQVNRLLRISFGPFHLGKIARGEFEEVPRRQLHDALGGAMHADSTAKAKSGHTGWAKPKPKPRPRHKLKLKTPLKNGAAAKIAVKSRRPEAAKSTPVKNAPGAGRRTARTAAPGPKSKSKTKPGGDSRSS